jgi:hypothetical protein
VNHRAGLVSLTELVATLSEPAPDADSGCLKRIHFWSVLYITSRRPCNGKIFVDPSTTHFLCNGSTNVAAFYEDWGIPKWWRITAERIPLHSYASILGAGELTSSTSGSDHFDCVQYKLAIMLGCAFSPLLALFLSTMVLGQDFTIFKGTFYQGSLIFETQ